MCATVIKIWKSEAEVKLRQPFGQFVLVSGSHLEPMTRCLFSVWQFRVSWYGALSLTRGWVRNFLVQLLLCLASAVALGFESRKTHDHTLLPHFRLSKSGGPVSILMSPRKRVALVGGFHFRHLLRLHGYDSTRVCKSEVEVEVNLRPMRPSGTCVYKTQPEPHRKYITSLL
jgi:hypothetical protein